MVDTVDRTASDYERTIDAGRIARMLAADWGFHHTATENLEHVAAKAAELPADAGERAARGVAELRRVIDAQSKTKRWGMRARIGTRKQWYRDVEEVER